MTPRPSQRTLGVKRCPEVVPKKRQTANPVLPTAYPSQSNSMSYWQNQSSCASPEMALSFFARSCLSWPWPGMESPTHQREPSVRTGTSISYLSISVSIFLSSNLLANIICSCLCHAFLALLWSLPRMDPFLHNLGNE